VGIAIILVTLKTNVGGRRKHQEDAESSNSGRGQLKEKKKAFCSSQESNLDLDGKEAKFTSLFPEFFSNKWKDNSSIHYF
jgi:hypothetical protein